MLDFATIVDEDIIFQEILPRLPTNSLCRLKSVCKKWLNLLTHDPVFFAHHSRKGPNPNTTNITGFFSVDFELFFSSDGQYSRCMKPPGFEIGSTNGLIYGVSSANGPLRWSCCNQIFIWNPITKHTVYVPNPTMGISLLALACDPYNPTFGFTLVHPFYLRKEEVYQFRVYSSKTGEWRVSKNASAVRAPRGDGQEPPAVYVGGKIYWCIKYSMLWFDIEKDVAGLLKCPKSDDENFVVENTLRKSFKYMSGFYRDPTFSDIGGCDGELNYITMTQQGDIEIWLLIDKNDELGWVKKYTVGVRGIFEQNWELLSRSCYLRVEEAQEEDFALYCWLRLLPYFGGELVWFVTRTGFKVFSFNLKTQELKLINEGDDEDESDIIIPPLYPFVPTILPCPT